MAGKRKGQPRALDSSLSIQGEPELYRAGMYAELQKFEDITEARQLLLSEDYSGEEATEVEVTGLDFSVSENKAFSALQVLLDKTDYQGNLPGLSIYSEYYKNNFVLPRLSMTFSEYLDAYGLQKGSNGRYSRAQRDGALKALESLTGPRRIVYERKYYKGKRRVSDMVVARSPLISLLEGYKELEEPEAQAIRDGQSNSLRVTKLVVEFSPLFVDRLDTFYLLKPVRLHQEIQDQTGKARISRAVSLFIEWLLTKNTKTVRISRDDLATKVRLEYLIKQRKPALTKERLDEAFQVAKDLGYLLDYQEDAFGMMTFTLNPERIRRIVMKKRAN